jgi:hypothetical protein
MMESRPAVTRLATVTAHLVSSETATVDVLVAATRPAIRGQEEPSPVAWGGREWEAMAVDQGRQDILDRGMLREVDRAAFLRDGVLVLPGVMARPAELADALRQAQVRKTPSCPRISRLVGSTSTFYINIADIAIFPQECMDQLFLASFGPT